MKTINGKEIFRCYSLKMAEFLEANGGEVFCKDTHRTGVNLQVLSADNANPVWLNYNSVEEGFDSLKKVYDIQDLGISFRQFKDAVQESLDKKHFEDPTVEIPDWRLPNGDIVLIRRRVRKYTDFVYDNKLQSLMTTWSNKDNLK